MANTLNTPTCPVCKRSEDRIQIWHVYLGHGRYTEYICCDCKIIFPWGDNKFGDITHTDQIGKVVEVIQGHDFIEVRDHEGFRETPTESTATRIKRRLAAS